MTTHILTAAALGLVLATGTAAAQQFDSAYTDLELDAGCSLVSSDEWGATWSCPGYAGIPVLVSEGDLRFFVSYGPNAAEEPAVSQTPPPFNTINSKLEWRLKREDGRWVPFATILRYYTSLGYGEGDAQILVVTQLLPGATCQIAYVDATANRDANVLAREAADRYAGSYDCNAGPMTVGRFAAWDF